MAEGHQHAGHAHAQGHVHSARPTNAADRRRLMGAVALAGSYMIAEVIGGLWTGSLALLADAGHMLSDVGALSLSLLAAWMVTRAASSQKTFGYYRLEILAALVNGLTLIAVAAGITVEAVHRLQDPRAVESGIMLVVAIGGLLVNLAAMAVLHGGRESNLNLRGAWLHVVSDTLGSVGVIAAAVCIRLFGWVWVDPLASVVISLLIVHASWRLLAEAVGVLMESAPGSIDVDTVRQCLLESEGVFDVHCLHVWTITSGLDSLSAHVVVDPDYFHDDQLRRLNESLCRRFEIGHITLQLEPQGFAACSEQPANACQITPPGR